MIIFAEPSEFVLLVLPFVFYVLTPAVKGMHGDSLKVPFIGDLKRISVLSGSVWNISPPNGKISAKLIMMYILWSLLCIAAARPQITGEPIRLKNESRNIMLVLDISTSMLEKDFSVSGYRATRLDAVKKVVSEFAKRRANDRLGLILFGTRAYLQAPLTFDKAGLTDILYSMQAGMAGDSTSIGDALALALKNLRNLPANEEKAIILLTDGENNDGSLSLAQAIKLAADENIRIYTIGVGSPSVFFQMLSMGGSGVDEQGLKTLAEVTQGQYFRADKTSELQKIYQLIDQLEPSTQDERYIQETTELYYIPLLLAFLLGMLMVWHNQGVKR